MFREACAEGLLGSSLGSVRAVGAVLSELLRGTVPTAATRPIPASAAELRAQLLVAHTLFCDTRIELGQIFPPALGSWEMPRPLWQLLLGIGSCLLRDKPSGAVIRTACTSEAPPCPLSA